MVSWAWRGIGACLSIVDGLFFISFHVPPWWNKVIIIFQNAGSMKDHVRTYIHELLGVPQSCVHYINCSKCGSVSRARYFFTSSSTAILPTSTFSHLITAGLLLSNQPPWNLVSSALASSTKHDGWRQRCPNSPCLSSQKPTL